MAVLDYAVIQVCSHTILCVGGAISVDRQYRLDSRPRDKEVYWENEAPVFDRVKLDMVSESFKVNTVITHSAPSFCELTSKSGLSTWGTSDKTLASDVAGERKVMDEIYTALKERQHPLRHWYFGHFHQSWSAVIDGVGFRMLDVMEVCENQMIEGSF